jgi:hypothetical protein
LVLLTNGIGGMARLCVDLGRVNSKYDCALGANLNPTVPVDRHVFVKRIRVWVNADGFLSPLDFKNLASFPGRFARRLEFCRQRRRRPHGGNRTARRNGRGKNTTVFHFSRPTEKRASGKQLPAAADVRLTVRVDIEDRNFHSETKRNGGADFHFSSNTHVRLPKFLKIHASNRLCLHARADRQLAFCRRRRISSAAGMVRKHSASGRADARPDRQRRRLQPRLV